MANGTIKNEMYDRAVAISTTFNNLADYGRGIFSLRTDANDPNNPVPSAGYWYVFQNNIYGSNTDYILQIATTSNIGDGEFRMRKKSSSGWTPWKSLSFT